MTEFTLHNAPLVSKMKKLGNRLHHDERRKLTYWVNQYDAFVPCPFGYITGPTTDRNTGGFYVSVYCKGGTWAQKTFRHDRMEEAKKWALEKANEQLKG